MSHLDALKSVATSSPAALRADERFRAPRTHLANGTLVVLNGWGLDRTVLGNVSRSLPTGPIALLYGDDESWNAAEVKDIKDAVQTPRKHSLVRHFAINHDAEVLRTFSHARQVPIGLNRAGFALPPLLRAHAREHVGTAHRSRSLLCCCMRPWKHRILAFESLRAAGHTHCNMSERRGYEELARGYLSHRFVACPHGHGRTDFRMFEVLSAGAVPVVEHFSEQDELFASLPVVRVRSWGEATPAFLDEEWARLQTEAATGQVTWTKVFFPFWLSQYTAHMGVPRAATAE